jgi:hypothetical protein
MLVPKVSLEKERGAGVPKQERVDYLSQGQG